jgi:hypothetical protein
MNMNALAAPAATLALAFGGAAVNEAISADIASADAVPAPITEVTIQSADISTSDIATKQITILADEHISEKGVNKNSTQTCKEFATFENSGESANGQRFWFIDHNGKLCRDKASGTGWVKVAGGMTGRNCGNEAKPEGPVPGPKAVGKVLMVPKFNMMVTLTAHSSAPAAESCGTATAEATATQKMNLGLFLRSNSAGKAKIEAKLDDKLTTSAHSHIDCTTSTTTTPNTPPVPPVPPVPPIVPPTPPELPPSIVMENMPTEGGFIDDSQQFCAEATSNPASDGVTVVFSDKYDMIPEDTIAYPDPNGDPNSYCVDETFDAVVPDEQVFATAIDNVDGQYASASSNPFPIRQSTGF